MSYFIFRFDRNHCSSAKTETTQTNSILVCLQPGVFSPRRSGSRAQLSAGCVTTPPRWPHGNISGDLVETRDRVLRTASLFMLTSDPQTGLGTPPPFRNQGRFRMESQARGHWRRIRPVAVWIRFLTLFRWSWWEIHLHAGKNEAACSGPAEAAGLPGTSVWRWGRSISEIRAGETPPRRPGCTHRQTDYILWANHSPRPRQHKHPQDRERQPSSGSLLFLEL